MVWLSVRYRFIVTISAFHSTSNAVSFTADCNYNKTMLVYDLVAIVFKMTVENRKY